MKRQQFEDAAGKPAAKPRKLAESQIYRDREHPNMKAKDEHRPTYSGDAQAKGNEYDNDVKDGWLRGSGENATAKPGFDHSKPKASGGPKNDASGKDMQKSPFSQAAKTY